MVGASVASFLRSSSPEHTQIANVRCGFQNFDDDASTAANTSSIASSARGQLGELQSNCFGSKSSSGFEKDIIEELALQVSMPEMPSLDFAPPSTPQKVDCSGLTSPPLAPGRQVMPRLMKALKLNSAHLVEEALVQEPGIAFFPFWAHHSEPPLCFAVRHRCSAVVVRLLLQHGADPDCTDAHGKSPADIVNSMRASMLNTAHYENFLLIEEILGVKSDVAAASPALPPHSPSDGMVGFQHSWAVGFQPSWVGILDFYANVPNHPLFHHQEVCSPWPAECGPAE